MPRRRHLSDGGCSEDGHQDQVEERPPQRNAANARERARMRVLAKAFCRLKTALPWVPADTKLSKLDTLRLATSYISHLSDILTTSQDGILPSDSSGAQQNQPTLHPLNLTWPFTFQQNTCGSQQQQQTHYHHHQEDAGEEHMRLHTHSSYPPPYSDTIPQIG